MFATDPESSRYALGGVQIELPPRQKRSYKRPPKRTQGIAVPVDPLIYRFHEITQVYGTTLKAIIHEMFGDGIMSAIDFTMEIERVPDPLDLGDAFGDTERIGSIVDGFDVRQALQIVG